MTRRRILLLGLLLAAIALPGCRNYRPGEGGRPLVVGLAERSCDGKNVVCRSVYARAVYAAGGVPFVLPVTTNAVEVARLLAQVDALVLCGGEDVDPVRYRTPPSPALEKVNGPRDDWEYALLDEAVRRRLPVVGICRGQQIVNVYFGGTLWQDLPSECGTRRHRHGGEGGYVHHPVAIVPGSRLSAIMGGATHAEVNSFHHQAVRDVAPGFRVAARAPDGVIEAIESETLPVAAVQFHPEALFIDEGRAAFAGFFRRLLDWAGPLCYNSR